MAICETKLYQLSDYQTISETKRSLVTPTAIPLPHSSSLEENYASI